MYAIIATGGKQYKVSEGDIITVEKLDAKEGDQVTFDKVLAVNDKKIKVGKPYIKDAAVTASVVANGRSKKVLVMKYKPKKGERTKNGHRQCYTKVKIEAING